MITMTTVGFAATAVFCIVAGVTTGILLIALVSANGDDEE